MDTWTTPYNLVRSVKLHLVDGTTRREYRLFELLQDVLALDSRGTWSSTTYRSVHCEYGRIGQVSQLHDWTGSAKAHKYDELLDEKVRTGYAQVDSGLAPTVIPSLTSFGMRPRVTSPGRKADDYQRLVDTYLTGLDEPTRGALVVANTAFCRTLLGLTSRPPEQRAEHEHEHDWSWWAPFAWSPSSPAQSLCLLMLAERALITQYYVDYVVSELAGDLTVSSLLAEASPGLAKMLEELGCDNRVLLDLQIALTRLSATAQKVLSA